MKMLVLNDFSMFPEHSKRLGYTNVKLTFHFIICKHYANVTFDILKQVVKF